LDKVIFTTGKERGCDEKWLRGSKSFFFDGAIGKLLHLLLRIALNLFFKSEDGAKRSRKKRKIEPAPKKKEKMEARSNISIVIPPSLEGD